jgi:hypothetical protein
MKRTILYLLTFIMLTWQGLAAQSAQSGSRLNMTTKKEPASAENLRFSGMPSGLTYKPLSLQNPKALNKFYRTFLFSNKVATESTGIQEVEVITKNVEKRSVPIESSLKTEEQLYVSDVITVSNIYPNPASERAELDYTITGDIRDAKVIFYNVLGSKMKEYVLTKSNRKLNIDTAVMPTGLYFYQLSVEGKKVATKKMLVRHQQ